MMIRGPGIAPRQAFTEIGSNVDVAPTLLALAGIDPAATVPPMNGKSLRAAVKLIKKIQPGTAVICTSVTTPVRRTFSRARGVFIFVRNFSCEIFLRESLCKVAAGLDACHFVSRDQPSRKYPLGARARETRPEIPHSQLRQSVLPWLLTGDSALPALTTASWRRSAPGWAWRRRVRCTLMRV
jgi:hypothetical protein